MVKKMVVQKIKARKRTGYMENSIQLDSVNLYDFIRRSYQDVISKE